MVLSISLWNEYSNLSHTLMLALQGGDKELVSETAIEIIGVMTRMQEKMDEKIPKDEQYKGLIE